MDTGALDVLHDAGDEDGFAVADGIDLDLFTEEVFVDQNRVVLTMRRDDGTWKVAAAAAV